MLVFASVDFLFTFVALIHVMLFQYMILLLYIICKVSPISNHLNSKLAVHFQSFYFGVFKQSKQPKIM